MLLKRKTSIYQLVLIVTILCSSNNFVFADNDHSQQHILQSASELDYPPFAIVRPDGSADGFSVDLLKAVAGAANLEVNISVGPWYEIKEQLAEGRLDVLPLVSYSLDRDKIFDFTVPYLRMHGTIFVRQGEESIRNETDLKDKEVLVMRGDMAHEYAVSRNLTSKLILTTSFEEAMRLLSSGKHDAVFCQYLMGLQLIKKLGVANIVSVSQQDVASLKLREGKVSGFEQKFCLAVPEGRKDLLARLNEGLAIVNANGTYEELFKKWFSPILPRPAISYARLMKYLLVTLIPILVLATFFGFWYLRREVTRKTKMLRLEIQERKQADEALRERTDFLNKIIDISAVSMWISDEKGTAIRANPSCFEFFGASREEVIGKYNLFQDEVIKKHGFMPVIEEVFEKGKPATITIDYDFGAVDHVEVKNATHKIVNSIFTPVLDNDGRVTNVIVQAIDLTDIKKNEDALCRSEERFRLAFHTSPDSINISKMDGTFVEVNRGFTELTGYTQGDVIGKYSEDIKIWANPEDRKKLIDGLVNDGFVKNLESTFRMKDGSSKIGLVSASIINLAGEPHILSVSKDITRLRETEKAHEKLESHLRQAQKLESIGVLAGGIAHDFNNMLSAILGNINLAIFDDNLTDNTKKLLADAEKASLRARDMTQQLLTFSKGGEPVKEISSLEGIIKDSADFVLHGSKITCDYHISPDLWLVDIDKGQISQVIQNIVLNAIHAMPEGGVIQIDCENITAATSDSTPQWLDGKYVKISIHDSGIGISEKHTDKIFDPYFSTKQTGSGLGLAICKSIVKKHAGDILVDSTPGSGTTFSIYLPASAKSQSVEQIKDHDFKISSQNRILLMDDEEMVRNVAREMLQKLGCEVLISADGVDAVKLYKEAMDSPDTIQLVILDLTIPGGMGGKDVVREILKVNQEAKVVVASGYSNDAIMANFKDYGFCASIAKPFQIQDLAMVLGQVLD